MSSLKIIHSLDFGSLIRQANNAGITKESYIDIIKQGETYILLYEDKGED